MTTSFTDSDVKDLIQERYGNFAQSVSDASDDCCDTSCCGDSNLVADKNQLYEIDQLEGLPDEAMLASAGCGNPTAIGDLHAGETVVDFGSGGGIDCFIAAKAVGEQGKVIGIDMTPNMIDLARKNAETLGLPNVQFHLAEMENTPLDDNSVDVIISNCVINLAPDKDAVFKEAFRILKPGGRMFISDMVLTAALPAHATEDAENWVSCLSGAEPQDVYMGRMADAGLTDISILESKPWQGKEEWASRVHSANILAHKA